MSSPIVAFGLFSLIPEGRRRIEAALDPDRARGVPEVGRGGDQQVSLGGGRRRRA